MKYLILLWLGIFIIACTTPEKNEITAEQWKEIELTFQASETYPNAYTDVEFWIEFTGPKDEKIIRPGFWFEGNT